MLTSASEAAFTLHVATDGNDEWSGLLERPNTDGTDGPFASIERARDEIRRLDFKPGTEVLVLIQDGIYFLSEPLVFEESDSGSPAVPMIYRAAEGASPVISGGELLTGWKETTHNSLRAWQTTVAETGSEFDVRQLFVNDHRRQRPRMPEEGFYQFTDLPEVTEETAWHHGQTMANYAEGDIQDWENLQDVEVHAMHLWSNSRLPIARIEEASRTVYFQKESMYRLTDDVHATGASTPGSRYYLDNVKEALDSPGEWYLDKPTRTLTYLPLEGETLDSAVIITPRLTQIVQFQPGAKNITLDGLTFAHQEWMYSGEFAGMGQSETLVPGVVFLNGAEDCILENCTIARSAGYAVEIEGDARRNLIRRCRMEDLGAGGVRMEEGTRETTVSDCTINNGGILFPSACGVLIMRSHDNIVIHNEIANLYYTGISVGWTWGYALPSQASGNILEHNHIHDIGKGLLSDMGGIYSLGVAPGTRMRYNHIHDVNSNKYGGWGLYTDEGSSGVLQEYNLVYRTSSAGFHQHYGRENVIRNNIFLFGGEAGVMKTRTEDHLSFVFERNIVVSNNGLMIKGPDYVQGKVAFINNIYHDTQGNKMDFAGATWEEWQAKSLDYQSLVADPLFVDLEGGDTTLKPDSPALELGFIPFDVSDAGPRP